MMVDADVERVGALNAAGSCSKRVAALHEVDDSRRREHRRARSPVPFSPKNARPISPPTNDAADADEDRLADAHRIRVREWRGDRVRRR